MIYFFTNILILTYIRYIKSKSEEYYECLNPYKAISSPDECISINIPESEGFKCCSMSITYDSETSYNCIVLETQYTKDQNTLNEYFSKRSMASLFTSVGGEMKVDCGSSLKIEENYKKYSDEFFNCYNGHIKGVENENDCINIDIPIEENNKCCYLEITKLDNNGEKINDKRCYIIDNIYFSEQKSLNDFLLDETKLSNLKYIKNTNITINCKNNEIFYFKGNLDYSKKIPTSLITTPSTLISKPTSFIINPSSLVTISSSHITITPSHIIKPSFLVDFQDKKSDIENSESKISNKEISSLNILESNLTISDNPNINIENKKSGKKKWIIIIIIICIFVFLIALILLIRFCIRKKRGSSFIHKYNGEIPIRP